MPNLSSTRTAVALLVPLLAALSVRAAAAQVAPGSRVRVRVDSPPPAHVVIGTVRSIDSRTLVLTPAGEEVDQYISVSAIGRLEVSRRRTFAPSHVLIGAGVGTGIGALLGVMIGGAAGSSAGWNPQGALLPVGALLGAVTGALLGALNKRDTWQSVPLQPRVALAPLPTRGVGVGLTVAF